MNLRVWKSGLERRLRAARPTPSDQVVNSIVEEIERARTTRRARPQLRLAGLTMVAAVGLLAVGGLGFAMSYAPDFVVAISRHIAVGTRTNVRTIVVNAANDEYGTTTTTTTTEPSTSTTTTTVATTTTAPATTTNSDGSKSAEVPPTSPGSVTVAPPTDSTQQVSVDWSRSTFTKPVVISVDPTPPIGPPAFAEGGSIVSIVVKDAVTGVVIHALDAPLEIVFANAPKDFVPAVSEDGVDFRPLADISAPPLPDSAQDGYYRVGSDIHVLTRHLTQFAVLAKADLTSSESGRKTPAGGSGKFGDPTRIHVGPPVVAVIGNATAVGTEVVVSFFVDEQVALYVQVLAHDTPLVLGSSSTIRKHRIGGNSRKTLHVVVLRPGTITLSLQVPRLQPGAKVRLATIDFDGHKVTKIVSVK